jgi:hypothetical protein
VCSANILVVCSKLRETIQIWRLKVLLQYIVLVVVFWKRCDNWLLFPVLLKYWLIYERNLDKSYPTRNAGLLRASLDMNGSKFRMSSVHHVPPTCDVVSRISCHSMLRGTRSCSDLKTLHESPASESNRLTMHRRLVVVVSPNRS